MVMGEECLELRQPNGRGVCLSVPASLKLHSQVGNDRFRVVFPAETLLLETAILRIPNHKTKGTSCVFPATVGGVYYRIGKF